MKVEYDQIIKNLKNRQLESTATRVQACLNQLNVSCMSSDSKQNSEENFDVFVGRLLRACGTLLQENADLTTSEAEEIAVAVKLSCEAFQTRSNLGSEGVQLEFSLYHIIIGLLRMKCYEWAILLAVQLKSFLTTSDNKIVSTIVHNCYVMFWNSAVEVEQKIEKLFLEDGRHRQALQLRCAALQFLCLKVEEAKNVAEKARKAMLWFLTNSNDQQEVEPDLANKFFFSILHSIVQSVIKQNDSCLSLVSVLLGFLLDWNITMYRHCSNSSYKFELTSQWVAIMKDLVSSDMEEVSRLLKKCIELVDAVTQVLIPQESYLEKQRSLKQVDNYESIVKLISSEFPRMDLLLQTLDSCSNIVFDFVKELGNSESNTRCSPGVSLAILPVLKLHMKLLVRQQETDLLSVNQLLTQTHCKVFTASLRLLRELVYQSQESKTWKAVVQDVLEEAKILENGLDLFVGDSNTFSNSLMLSGTEAGNLGIIFFNQSCYQEAIPFLDLSCRYLTYLIETSDLTSELMKSCTDSLFKKFELLAQCYCQIGNLKEALAAVVKGLKWNMNKLDTAIEIWLKVKREAFRKNNKDIIKITIQHQLDNLGITVDRLDQVELLQAELIGYKSERYDAVDACYAVVLALLQISETNLEKGFVLTELAELIWSHNFPFKWTAAECSQRAVDLLEEVIKMSDLSEFQMVQAKLQLASSYFWLYETRIQELQKVSQEEVKKSPISSLEDKQETNRILQGDEDDKDDVCDINPAYPHVNLQLEIESLKPLDSALNLWKDVFLAKNGVQQVVVKDKQIIEYIKTAAELYAVLQHIYQEIQALHVLQQSAHLLNNHSEEIYSISRLVHILSEFKMLDVAETLVKKGEDLLKEITDAQTLSLQLPILQSRFMLAYLEFLYHSGKFDTGHKLLKQFDSSSLWEKNTKTTMLLQAETKLVACLFNLLPSSAFGNGSIQRDDCASKNKLFPENPTILALDAWKVCMGLIKYLSSTEAQKSCKDYLSYKPALLHTLLSSTMLVGQLYIDVGAPREARCYLKDTLKVAQEMALACRSAEFLLTLANLDALCENINDCRVKLNGVEYILHTSLPATSVNYQVVKEKDELSDGSDEEDFLVRRPGRSLRGTVREQLLHGHEETGSSPISQQRVKTSIPTQWEHSMSCCCNLCQHIKLHSLELEIVGLQAYCLAAMGSRSQAIRWLKNVLKLETFITDKVDSLLSSAVKMISMNNNVSNKQKYGKTNSVFKNTSFLLPLSKIRSELARLHISDGNHQWALKEIKLSLVELKENAQPFYVSNMYALILYQQAILRLQMCSTEGNNFMNISNNVWFIKTVESNTPDAYVSPVDEISNNIAKISLDDKFDTKTKEYCEVEKTPATFIMTKKPVKSNGMTRSCRAPTKKAPKTVVRNYLNSLGTSAENQSKLKDEQKCASLMYEFGTTDDDEDIGSDECFVENSYKGRKTKSSAGVLKRGKSQTQRTQRDLNVVCDSKTIQPELSGLFITPMKSRRQQLKRYPTATELDTSREIPEKISDRLTQTDNLEEKDIGDDTVQKVLHSQTKKKVLEALSPDFNKDPLLNIDTMCQMEKENGSDVLHSEKQLKKRKNKIAKDKNSVKEVPNTKRITRLRKKQNESTKMTVEHPRDDDSSILDDVLTSPVLEFALSPDIPLKDSEFFKNWSPKLSEIELIASEGQQFPIRPRNKQKSVTFSLGNDTFMSKISDVGSPEVFRVTEEAPVTSFVRNNSSKRKPLSKKHTKAKDKNLTSSIINSESHNTSDKEEATSSVVRSSVSDSNITSLLSCHETLDVRSNLEISPQSHLTERWCEENHKGTLLMKVKQDLSEALSLIQHHPPCPLYGNICQLLSLLSGVEDNGFPDIENQRIAAAHYFSESVAVTLRHQASICLTKKIRNTSAAVEVIPVENPLSKESQKFTIEVTDKVQKEILQFSDDQKFQKIMERIDYIPEGWTVIQVCAVPQDFCLTANFSHFTVPDLLVCRYRHGQTPTFVLFNSSQDTQFQTSFLKEFHTILEESAATMQKEDPKTWWTIRYALDNRLKELTESMENMWLGCWKGVFLGKVDDEDYTSTLKNTIKNLVEMTTSQGLHCSQQDLLEILVDSSSQLNDSQLSSCINLLWNLKATDSVHQNIFKIIRDSEKKPSKPHSRQPVLLILDKYVQPLPWESLPMLQHSPVSRIPSLHLLHSQLSLYKLSPNTIFNRGINSTKTYYVLNPSNDIPHTQKKFEEAFKSMKGWNGIVGQKPSNQELSTALTENDLFLYCGHGSGRVYLAGESIERLQCRSAAILMGCSSGKLKVFGQQLEPTGVVLQYWLGGSPCVVANLWDVTDKDIDRFTESLLELWLPQWKDKTKDNQASFITAALPVARQACKLKYLIGSAPVVYGLPVFTVK